MNRSGWKNVRTPWADEERKPYLDWIYCRSGKPPPVTDRSYAAISLEFRDDLKRVAELHGRFDLVHLASLPFLDRVRNRRIRESDQHRDYVEGVLHAAFFTDLHMNTDEEAWMARRIVMEEVGWLDQK